MSELDQKRWSAVAALEKLGWGFRGGERRGPQGGDGQNQAAADVMHGVLMDRAEKLVGCIEGSDDEKELMAIGEAREGYEAVRWPLGRIAGGKG